MGGYRVAHLDDIGEVSDGRCSLRPIRHHFGIMSFGVNAWTGRAVGDRIINEHDESDDDSDEELYLVHRGRARFELDGERVDAPAGTFVFARPGVKRTAFAEEPNTTIVALGGDARQGLRAFRFRDLVAGRPALRGRRVRRGGRARPRADRGASRVSRRGSTTSPAARAWPAGRPMRSSTSGSRSADLTGTASGPRVIPTSIRSAPTRHSRSSWVNKRCLAPFIHLRDLARTWMRSPCLPSRLRISTGWSPARPEPVRQPGVELGDFAGSHGDVVVGQDQSHLVRPARRAIRSPRGCEVRVRRARAG